MKKLILGGMLVLLTACATVSPLEEANIDTGVVYLFTSSTLNSSLYVKILPDDSEVGGLLFKPVNNGERVNTLEFGAPGVYHQEIFSATIRGKVSFRFFEEGLFEELLRHHQYASSGGQQDKISMFRYRLDFRKAVKLE